MPHPPGHEAPTSEENRTGCVTRWGQNRKVCNGWPLILDLAPPMSYYLALIGTTDSPIYEAELGTYRQGGDGVPKVSFEVSMR